MMMMSTMTTITKSILLIGLGVLVALAAVVRAEVNDESASNALNLFGMKFLAETSGQLRNNTNIVLSPYTVWMAMSIVNEGARGNTAAELSRALFIPTNESDRKPFRKLQQRLTETITRKHDGVTLQALNSVFTRTEAVLKQEYVKLVRDVYNVDVRSLDFNNATAAAQYINKLLSDATNGRITDIINAGSVRDSYMLITSALFFKGLWDKKFDKSDTKPEPFYNEQREVIGTIPMMHTSGAFPFGQILNGKAIAVELPYVGGKLCTILVLPVEGASLSSILHAISEMSIGQIVDYLKKSKEAFRDSLIVVRLPKLRISTSLELGDVLKTFGILNVFDGHLADLSGASSSPLYVSRVLHRTEIEIDEEGTAGSSATVVDVIDKIAPAVFNANRPFAFFVIDKESQTMVFAGKGNKLSMVAVLPVQGVSLSTVLNALTNVNIPDLVRSLNKTEDYSSVTDVTVGLPRFNISLRLDLDQYFEEAGVQDAFGLHMADLSGISQSTLSISRVLHKTAIEMNEEGTVGSSVTVVEITDRISDVDYFKADRPFAFIIYDKVAKAVVFAGKFSSPPPSAVP